MGITLKHQDCMEYLKTLEDESVDLICVDPPYFEIITDSWDNQWKGQDAYLEWCREWTEECFRVLKTGRCFYVWGTTKEDTLLRYKLEVLNNIDDAHYKNWIIWAYDWGGRTKKTFARKHEDVLMYSKGKDFLFNADDIRVPRAVKTNMNITRKTRLIQAHLLNPRVWRNQKDQHSWEKYSYNKKTTAELENELATLGTKNTLFAKGKIPTDVWTKNNHTTSKEYAGWHPTQKPIALLERIIKANTNPGDVVMDCFVGSGSTMVAAANLGRDFTGCEFDKDYCDKAIARFEELTGLIYDEDENVLDI
jgi:DNA modification methylase